MKTATKCCTVHVTEDFMPGVQESKRGINHVVSPRYLESGNLNAILTKKIYFNKNYATYIHIRHYLKNAVRAPNIPQNTTDHFSHSAATATQIKI